MSLNSNAMIYKAKSKRRPHFVGQDCSGPSAVLPPTFCGIAELVRRAGSIDAAALQYPTEEVDQEGKDIVESFLQDLELCDKAERVELISDFSEFVNSLQVPKDTEAPKDTEVPKETEPPKETDVPKETEAPKETAKS